MSIGSSGSPSSDSGILNFIAHGMRAIEENRMIRNLIEARILSSLPFIVRPIGFPDLKLMKIISYIEICFLNKYKCARVHKELGLSGLNSMSCASRLSSWFFKAISLFLWFVRKVIIWYMTPMVRLMGVR